MDALRHLCLCDARRTIALTVRRPDPATKPDRAGKQSRQERARSPPGHGGSTASRGVICEGNGCGAGPRRHRGCHAGACDPTRSGRASRGEHARRRDRRANASGERALSRSDSARGVPRHAPRCAANPHRGAASRYLSRAMVGPALERLRPAPGLRARPPRAAEARAPPLPARTRGRALRSPHRRRRAPLPARRGADSRRHRRPAHARPSPGADRAAPGARVRGAATGHASAGPDLRRRHRARSPHSPLPGRTRLPRAEPTPAAPAGGGSRAGVIVLVALVALIVLYLLLLTLLGLGAARRRAAGPATAAKEPLALPAGPAAQPDASTRNGAAAARREARPPARRAAPAGRRPQPAGPVGGAAYSGALGGRLGEILAAYGVVPMDALMRALARQLRIRTVTDDDIPLPLLTAADARAWRAVAIEAASARRPGEGAVPVAMRGPDRRPGRARRAQARAPGRAAAVRRSDARRSASDGVRRQRRGGSHPRAPRGCPRAVGVPHRPVRRADRDRVRDRLPAGHRRARRRRSHRDDARGDGHGVLRRQHRLPPLRGAGREVGPARRSIRSRRALEHGRAARSRSTRSCCRSTRRSRRPSARCSTRCRGWTIRSTSSTRCC